MSLDVLIQKVETEARRAPVRALTGEKLRGDRKNRSEPRRSLLHPPLATLPRE